MTSVRDFFARRSMYVVDKLKWKYKWTLTFPYISNVVVSVFMSESSKFYIVV